MGNDERTAAQPKEGDQMKSPLFRGYVPTRNKQCLEKFKGVEKLKTRSEVQDLEEYAGILGEETILIDVDDAETSDLLFQIVRDLGLKCRVYKTTRGKHFYFRNPEGYVEKAGQSKPWRLVLKQMPRLAGTTVMPLCASMGWIGKFFWIARKMIFKTFPSGLPR